MTYSVTLTDVSISVKHKLKNVEQVNTDLGVIWNKSYFFGGHSNNICVIANTNLHVASVWLFTFSINMFSATQNLKAAISFEDFPHQKWFYQFQQSLLVRVWPWWCVWAGRGYSCPDSWCILTRRCWGGGLSATGSPTAGLPPHCPCWRWWQLYLQQHPRVSRSCPLRRRSVGSCQGSSWPGGFKVGNGEVVILIMNVTKSAHCV